MEFDKINGNVGFNEEQHIYQDLNTGKRFISCTTLIHHYNNFNKELISGKKALEALRPALYPSYKQVLNKVNSISDSMLVMFGVTREEFEVKRKEITDGWEAIANEACIKGTAYHLDMEHALYAKNNHWLKEHMGDREHYCKQGDFDIMRQDVGVFPEYLIHWSSDDDMLKIAGQVDVLIKDGQFIDILDFKSSREIRKTSFFNPKTKRTTKMKSPLNMLDDCNFNHYNLQLSMYAWMVTQQHPELQVRTLKILHHDHDGNNTVYEMPFLKDRVEDIVKDYHKKVKIEKQRAELNNLL